MPYAVCRHEAGPVPRTARLLAAATIHNRAALLGGTAIALQPARVLGDLATAYPAAGAREPLTIEWSPAEGGEPMPMRGVLFAVALGLILWALLLAPMFPWLA